MPCTGSQEPVSRDSVSSNRLEMWLWWRRLRGGSTFLEPSRVPQLYAWGLQNPKVENDDDLAVLHDVAEVLLQRDH